MVAARPLIASLLLLLTAGAATAPAAAECVALGDFSQGQVGEFPPDWKPRKDVGRAIYSIEQEGSLRFLHAASWGLGIQAGKEVQWRLEAYPVLAWSWRPLEFPKGADERKAKANDSALAVYALFPHSPVSVKSLKYIWSAIVPPGTRLTSSTKLTQVRVLRAGTSGRGQWVQEQVNVLEDYRKAFQAVDVPRPVGIAVLTDSDDTKSSAQGDYAGFRVCKP